jgi:hypothetical protein
MGAIPVRQASQLLAEAVPDAKPAQRVHLLGKVLLHVLRAHLGNIPQAATSALAMLATKDGMQTPVHHQHKEQTNVQGVRLASTRMVSRQ